MWHFTPLSYKTQFFQNRWASSNVLCTRWSGSSNVEVWQSILAAGALFSPGALAFVFQHQLSSIFLFHWPRGSCRCHFFSGFFSCVQRLVWSLLTEILLCTQHSHCFTSIKLIIEKCPSGISGRTSFADVDIEYWGNVHSFLTVGFVTDAPDLNFGCATRKALAILYRLSPPQVRSQRCPSSKRRYRRHLVRYVYT